MKKLFLFLTVLAFGVSFSSCLKMDNSFTDPLNLVYINEHNGAIYGKTQGGRLITNPKFQLMDINSLHLMSYNWDEKQHGTSNIGAATVFNVQLIEEIPITKTYLYTNQNPEESDLFTRIATPIRDEYGMYFDDLWTFQYYFEALEGEKTSVSFSLRDDATEEGSNTVKVDVYLSIYGEPKEGETKKKEMTDLVAVDLSQIRSKYVSNTNKEVNIEFYYHKEADKDPIAIKDCKMRYVEENN